MYIVYVTANATSILAPGLTMDAPAVKTTAGGDVDGIVGVLGEVVAIKLEEIEVVA